MIVVDANILVYWHVPHDMNDLADSVRRADPEWNAPRLWRSEFRNAMAGLLRAGRLTFEQCLGATAEAELMMREMEHEVSSAAVLELVASSSASAYDYEYVALARDLDVPLVSNDEALAKAFPDTVVSMKQFVSTRRPS
jgi:predicted nucleic acid-binding protein